MHYTYLCKVIETTYTAIQYLDKGELNAMHAQIMAIIT